MKKIAALLILLCSSAFCDTKISALPSTTTLNSVDIIPVVTNPSTSPGNFSITKSNLLTTLGIVSSGSTNYWNIPSTGTFPASFGISATTITASGNVQISSNAILSGATFYQNGTLGLGGSLGASGQVVTSGGPGAFLSWVTPSSGSGGQLIYPATGTASFPFGASFSTISVSGLTISNAASHLGTGTDIIFSTMSDCSFNLKWDTETVSGFQSWVNIPTVSASVDTNFYICYGSSTLTTYQGVSSATWDSSFQGVYHFPNGTTLSARDSTTNAINLSGTATPTAGTGEVDGGLTLNGSTQYEQSPSATNFNFTTNGTAEGWVNLNNLSSNQGLIGKNAQATDRNGYDLQVQTSGKLFIELASASANIGGLTTSAITSGAWHHLAMTWNGTTLFAYIDGVKDATSFSQTLTPVSNVWPLIIGASGEQLFNFLGGKIDEVRLSNTARSADWISTEYNSVSNPSGFITAGSETTGGSGFTYKRKLTINHSLVPNTDQTNFPVLVTGLSSSAGTLTFPSIVNSLLATDSSGVVISTTVSVLSSSGTQNLIQLSNGGGGLSALAGVSASTTEISGSNSFDINAPVGNNAFIFSHTNGNAFIFDVQNNSTGTANGDLVASFYMGISALNMFARAGQPYLIDTTGDTHWNSSGAPGVIQLRSSGMGAEGTPFTGLQVGATQQVLIPAAGINCDSFGATRTCPMVDGVTRFQVNGKVFISSNAVLSGTTFYNSAPAVINTMSVSTNGFVTSNGPTPTISSCGSTPNGSVVGDDWAGVITVGGTAPTACTLTFSTIHTGCTMSCNVNDNSLTISADVSSITTTALTLGFGVGGLAGGTVWYECHGFGSSCH